VLQCVAVCVAVWCSVLPCLLASTALDNASGYIHQVLQCVAVCVAVWCSVLQCVALCCCSDGAR